MESRTGSIGRAVLLLLCALAALAAARSIDVESAAEFRVDSASERVLEGFHFSRLERRATPVTPSWRCTGSFSSDGNTYNVRCTTNLDVVNVTCTLDGRNYACGGLVFSVDTSSFSGQLRSLSINVKARYGAGVGTLRYGLRFRKQVTSSTVTCTSRSSGVDVIITCTGNGITSLFYSINGAAFINSNSISSFTIRGRDLRVGSNTINLRITVNGVTRTTSIPVQKTQVFNTNCEVSSDPDGNVVVRCAEESNSEAIRSITYSINGGSVKTVSGNSLSQFQIDAGNLRLGQNTIILTLISISGTTRRTTVQVERTQARLFSVRCRASYDDKNNAVVECLEVGASEAIARVQYRINGGRRITAAVPSRFEIDGDLLTRVSNTIAVTLTSTGGLSKDLTLNLVQPLSLRCSSQTSSSGVTITCESNRDSSTLTVECYLDGVRQSNCDLNTQLDYSQFSQGRHTFTVVVTDSNDLTVRNQLSFENKLSTKCRGSLNLGSNVYAVECDSDRELQYTCILDGRVISCPDSLNIDVSTLQSGSHTLQLIGTDVFGSTATSTSSFNIPETVGSCDIDSDESGDIVSWRCTANAGVSIICLVDGIKLEDCICQLNSEFLTARYQDGDHTLSLILTRRSDGVAKTFTRDFAVEKLVSLSSQAIEPLEFECVSEPNDVSVAIDCQSNKEVEITCYLDDIEQDSCSLTGNKVAFADISQGPHTFAVVATDLDGLVDRSEIHFEEDLDLSCRGSYNPSQDVVHLACDATRTLASTQCILEDGSSIDCPTPYDVPVSDFVDNLYHLRVNAQDQVGNSDMEELVFSTSSCEGC